MNLNVKLVLCLAMMGCCHGFLAFRPSNNPTTTSNNNIIVGKSSSSVILHMGLFDGLKKAFQNQEYSAPPEGVKASARHILVKSKDQANAVLEKLSAGANFASLASEYSTCPSGSRGGSLGSFAPGVMVKAFDDVIFDPKTNIGEIVGPVQTNFGYHVIVVDKRTGV
jgi:peptidyl-prolyl cis-trans isomerase C